MSRAFMKERDDEPLEPVVVARPHRDADLAPPPDRESVGYGAKVVVEGVADEARTFTIAEPEHTDLGAGLLAIDSPLATALIGAHPGDRVVWHRPVGDRTLRVVSVTYDAVDHVPQPSD